MRILPFWVLSVIGGAGRVSLSRELNSPALNVPHPPLLNPHGLEWGLVHTVDTY